jgi:hypothetical protein
MSSSLSLSGSSGSSSGFLGDGFGFWSWRGPIAVAPSMETFLLSFAKRNRANQSSGGLRGGESLGLRYDDGNVSEECIYRNDLNRFKISLVGQSSFEGLYSAVDISPDNHRLNDDSEANVWPDNQRLNDSIFLRG